MYGFGFTNPIFGTLHKVVRFNQDDGQADGNTDDSAGADDEKNNQQNAGEENKAKVTFTPEQQLEVDRIVKERLDRASKKAEADAEKTRKKAEEDALAKNKEFETLASTRQTRIEELEKEIETATEVSASLDKYKDVVGKIAKSYLEKFPKPVQVLIEKMDPLEQLEYITANAKELNIDIKPVPPSETDDTGQKLKAEEIERAKKQTETMVKSLYS